MLMVLGGAPFEGVYFLTMKSGSSGGFICGVAPLIAGAALNGRAMEIALLC